MPEPDARVVVALRRAGCVFAEEEASLLAAEASSAAELDRLVTRRVAGEPLEQVLGWVSFCGLRLRVMPGVFVPRRRTELVVEVAREAVLAAERRHPTRRPVMVDLCCGTGAIGAALASATEAEVHACDIDAESVACARQNLPDSVVHQGDLLDALPDELRGRVDVLAVNTPYVPTEEIALLPPEARVHEHRVALDGGPDGLDLHRRVAATAPEWLRPGGTLVLETSLRQAAGSSEACRAAGFEVRRVRRVEPEAVVLRAISGPRRSSGTMAR